MSNLVRRLREWITSHAVWDVTGGVLLVWLRTHLIHILGSVMVAGAIATTLQWFHHFPRPLLISIGLVVFGIVFFIWDKLVSRPQASPAIENSLLVRSQKLGEIRFDYLPASPLAGNEWELADPNTRSGMGHTLPYRFSVPTDRPEGLAMGATPDDAIDYKVEKFQKGCNHLRFAAKLSHDAYVYAKVQMTSRDRQSVSRTGWIAYDVGNKPPRRISENEWVVYGNPGEDGWAAFDSSLPNDVKRTYGKEEGLEFNELILIRLRGSLSISPIELYRDTT